MCFMPDKNLFYCLLVYKLKKLFKAPFIYLIGKASKKKHYKLCLS